MEGTREREKPSEGELHMQAELVDYLIQKSPIKTTSGGNNGNAMAFSGNDLAMLRLGLNQQESNHVQRMHNSLLLNSAEPELLHKTMFGANRFSMASEGQSDTKDMFYLLLKRSQDILENAVDDADGEVKQKYEYLLMKINQALKIS